MADENGATEAVEAEAPDTGAEVHSSIADMLSQDSEASAIGGLDNDLEDVNLQVEAPAEVEQPEEKDETEVVETSTTEKEPAVIDWEAEAKAFKKMALDERQKRQDLQNPPAEQPAKADLFENPDERLAQETGQVADQATNQFLMLAESNARRHYGADKFNAAQEAFLSAAQTNPGLAQTAINSADPGEFQFQEGQKILTNQQLGENGGIEALTEKIRAEEKAKLDDLIKQGVEAKLKEIGKLPPNATTFAGKNNKTPVLDTNMSLSDILQR